MTGGRDGLVGELLKCGGSRMVYLLEQLFSVVWCEKLFLGNGERALLLICLRKVIRRIRVIIEVYHFTECCT